MKKSQKHIPIACTRSINVSKVLAGVLGAVFLFIAISGWSDAPQSQSPQTTIIYFLRHAEDREFLLETGKEGPALLSDCRPFLDNGQIAECCTEVLETPGEKRAQLLAKWFGNQGLLPTITHVFATHKIRTLQTVQPIAHAAVWLALNERKQR